jgi:glycosyltransferase involved in cell wall biosynthesis
MQKNQKTKACNKTLEIYANFYPRDPSRAFARPALTRGSLPQPRYKSPLDLLRIFLQVHKEMYCYRIPININYPAVPSQNLMSKKAIVSVINDLATDQRVNRTCLTLEKLGYDVLLVGRRQRKSLDLAPRSYRTKRMFLLFEKGPLFYAAFNFRLFIFLLFHKADVLVANDLDTLLPNFLASRLKRAQLVYDSHEYFTGVPELENSHFKRGVWKRLERWIFPKLKHVFTVNDSIAKLYKDEYGVDVKVLRNVPMLSARSKELKWKQKAQLGLPENKHIVLLQGAGINVDRGGEEAVLAMQYVKSAILLIIGSGDVIGKLKQMTKDLGLGEKIIFIGKLPFEELMQYTHHADIGITLDKDTNINYRYSLPNKLFDYIHSGIAVLASPLVEVEKIVKKYNVGEVTESHNPEHIANKIEAMLSDPARLREWKENAKLAAAELCWENEEERIKMVFRNFL